MSKAWIYRIISVLFYILMIAAGVVILGLTILTLVPIGGTMPIWGKILAVATAIGFACLVSSKTKKIGMGLLVSALVSAFITGSIVSTNEVAVTTVIGCLSILLCFLIFRGCKDRFVHFRDMSSNIP